MLDPETGRPRRYGDGGLAGRRAMVITTVGANAATTGPRGIHGELDEVLFPITHGTFWYSGMRVLAPFVVNGSVRLSEPEYADAAKRLTERLVALPDAETVSYRHQNGGDYFEHCSKVRPTSVDDVTHPGKDRPVGLFRTVLAEHLVLRDQHAPGETGVGIHQTGDVRCGRSGGDGEAPR